MQSGAPTPPWYLGDAIGQGPLPGDRTPTVLPGGGRGLGESQMPSASSSGASVSSTASWSFRRSKSSVKWAWMQEDKVWWYKAHDFVHNYRSAWRSQMFMSHEAWVGLRQTPA